MYIFPPNFIFIPTPICFHHFLLLWSLHLHLAVVLRHLGATLLSCRHLLVVYVVGFMLSVVVPVGCVHMAFVFVAENGGCSLFIVLNTHLTVVLQEITMGSEWTEKLVTKAEPFGIIANPHASTKKVRQTYKADALNTKLTPMPLTTSLMWNKYLEFSFS